MFSNDNGVKLMAKRVRISFTDYYYCYLDMFYV